MITYVPFFCSVQCSNKKNLAFFVVCHYICQNVIFKYHICSMFREKSIWKVQCQIKFCPHWLFNHTKDLINYYLYYSVNRLYRQIQLLVQNNIPALVKVSYWIFFILVWQKYLTVDHIIVNLYVHSHFVHTVLLLV